MHQDVNLAVTCFGFVFLMLLFKAVFTSQVVGGWSYRPHPPRTVSTGRSARGQGQDTWAVFRPRPEKNVRPPNVERRAGSGSHRGP